MVLDVKKKQLISSSQSADVFHSFLNAMSDLEKNKEHVWVLGLNSATIIEYAELVYIGTVNQALVDARDIFATAMLKPCNSVVICHNHPTGNVEPSREDIKLWHSLVLAGYLLNIQVLDFVIITHKNHNYYSTAESRRDEQYRVTDKLKNFLITNS